MDRVGTLILGKVFRFFLGILVTALSIGAGIFYGKSLQKQGITAENYVEKSRFDKYAVLRLLIIAGILIPGWTWLGKNTMIIERISTYSNQFAMISLRSLLGFIFALQWQISEDKTKLKRTGVILGIAFLVFLVVEGIILFPSFLFISGEVGKDGVVMQSTGSTCGPASLANILRVYGRKCDEKDVAIAMRTGMGGTTDTEGAAGAKLLGFPKAQPCMITFEEILREDLPLVVNVDFDGIPHDVGIIGVTSHTIFIADPAAGMVQYTHKEFQGIFKKRGIRLGSPAFPDSAGVRLSTFDPEKFRKFSLGPKTE